MIRPMDSLGEFLMFRCQVCQAIFDCAADISRGKQPVARSDGAGPDGGSVIDIHLKCPRCLERRTYKLRIRER